MTLEEDCASVPLQNDMTIRSGDVLTTGDNSYVDLMLGENKVLGLDQNSSARFCQEGQSLRVELVDGGLYFFTPGALPEGDSFKSGRRPEA